MPVYSLIRSCVSKDRRNCIIACSGQICHFIHCLTVERATEIQHQESWLGKYIALPFEFRQSLNSVRLFCFLYDVTNKYQLYQI